MCWDCNKRFNLTSRIVSPGHEVSPSCHTAKYFDAKIKQDSCVGVVTRGPI